jgi:transcriptional regulator with XRE-family HTH domain
MGRRVFEAREASGLTRVALATVLGIKPTRLFSYEHGRVPLPYSIALDLCRRANVNQRWLATGELPKHPFFRFKPEFEAGIDGRRRFSDVYAYNLQSIINAQWQSLFDRFGPDWDPDANTQRAPDADYEIALLTSELQLYAKSLPENNRRAYIDKIRELAESLVDSFSPEKQKRPASKSPAGRGRKRSG